MKHSSFTDKTGTYQTWDVAEVMATPQNIAVLVARQSCVFAAQSYLKGFYGRGQDGVREEHNGVSVWM